MQTQEKELLELLEEKQKIQEKINNYIHTQYNKYKGMSEEVKDDNPYRYSHI
jgi:hypothetical protein